MVVSSQTLQKQLYLKNQVLACHTIADYNLDGKDDLFVLGMSSTTANRLEQMNLNRPGYDKRNSARVKMGYGNRLYTKTKNGNYEEYPFESINEIVKTGWSWGVTSWIWIMTWT